MATERTMAELERVKLLKSYDQKISDLKGQIETDNQSWMRRFDIRNSEYKAQLESSNLEIEMKMRK